MSKEATAESGAASQQGPARGVCPGCGGHGSRVGLTTLRSLLTEDASRHLDAGAEYSFCSNASCDVVYFCDGGPSFSTADLRVTVFEKSDDPSRLVCYCFDHSVEEITSEVARTGTSVVPDEIAEKCRRGLDRCEQTNPRGACCLGNVRRVAKEAAAGFPDSTGDDGCCPSCSLEKGC